MFSRSTKTELAWKNRTGLSAPSYSTTRWWSKWEVLKGMIETFGDVFSFYSREVSHLLSSSFLKCWIILHKIELQMELAVTIDAGEPFVKATYRLEGDGPLVFTEYEEISTLRAGISSKYCRNVYQLLRMTFPAYPHKHSSL